MKFSYIKLSKPICLNVLENRNPQGERLPGFFFFFLVAKQGQEKAFRGNNAGLDKGKGDLWQIRGTQFRANALKGKRSKTRRGCVRAARS